MEVTDKKYIAVVVLYRELFSTAKTIRSLKDFCQLNAEKVHFVFWDNSPEEMPKKEFAFVDALEYEYIHTPENKPLSKIYNIVADAFKEQELLFLFDQDSIITDEYFHKCMEASSRNNEIGLFIPYIKYNDLVVSPGSFFIYKGRYWSKLRTGIISSHNVLAITSGMCIRMSCFGNGLKFDEALTLYGIDSKFCIDYSKNYSQIYVIDYQLNHNLSKFNKEPSSIKRKRLKSEIKAQYYIARHKSIVSYILALFTGILRYMYLNIKYIFQI